MCATWQLSLSVLLLFLLPSCLFALQVTTNLLTRGGKDIAFADYSPLWKSHRRLVHNSFTLFGEGTSRLQDIGTLLRPLCFYPLFSTRHPSSSCFCLLLKYKTFHLHRTNHPFPLSQVLKLILTTSHSNNSRFSVSQNKSKNLCQAINT